ncbi:hypothetical protein [Marmoricola sp. RAF53]|uniref:hypothetical protein n=1 Tax=Marmoricola sp. RAF53 TaxID=3233059 RepID=UPI003F9C8BAB
MVNKQRPDDYLLGEEPDVEGHLEGPEQVGTLDDDDVEGHFQVRQHSQPNLGSDDDVEGGPLT